MGFLDRGDDEILEQIQIRHIRLVSSSEWRRGRLHDRECR